MFDFFRQNKSSINSITIPSFGWDKEEETISKIEWINEDATISLLLNFFDIEPNIPTITDLKKIRDFYRNSISQVNGGLIEVDVIDLKGYKAIKTIFKVKQEPTGMIYLASLTIPFEKCSYVIKIQAPEFDVTGIRDAVILEKLLTENKITFKENGLENWFEDPYEKDFKSNCLMNKSELSIYDDMFVNHPLSQARKLIAEIEKGIEFKPEILRNKKFTK
jgi:hypothetical protein